MGLPGEFLDVTSQITATVVESRRVSGMRQRDLLRLTNTSATPIDTHLMLVVEGLPSGMEMANKMGVTRALPAPAEPYRVIVLDGGVLAPGASMNQVVMLRGRATIQGPVRYQVTVLSGQGRP